MTTPPSASTAALRAASVGLDALRSHRLRTTLCVIGVAAGVASLVAVLSLGDGMERAARQELERTTNFSSVALRTHATELVDGVRRTIKHAPVFTEENVKSASEIPGVRRISLVSTVQTIVQNAASSARREALVYGTLANADEFMSLTVAAGRYFTAPEATRSARVVVLTNYLARVLAGTRPVESLLGRTLAVGGEAYEVIGILAAYGGERTFAAYVPFAAAAKLKQSVGDPAATVLMLRAGSLEAVAALQAAARSWAREEFGSQSRAISVETSGQRLAQSTRAILVFKIFLGAMACVSLLVGGAGIMNVLLASVFERTREIGVRKASGARRRDILLQFLAESVVITGMGSITGVLVGWGAAWATVLVMRRVSTDLFVDLTMSWDTVAIAAILPVVIGLGFGIYPAQRAATLSPIDAIRHD